MLVSLSSQRVKVTVRREECNKSSKSELGHVRPDTVDLRILSLSWTNSVNLTTKNFFSAALLLTTSLPTMTPLVTPAPPVPQPQQILPPRRVSDLELLGNSDKVWISLLVFLFFFFLRECDFRPNYTPISSITIVNASRHSYLEVFMINVLTIFEMISFL